MAREHHLRTICVSPANRSHFRQRSISSTHDLETDHRVMDSKIGMLPDRPTASQMTQLTRWRARCRRPHTRRRIRRLPAPASATSRPVTHRRARAGRGARDRARPDAQRVQAIALAAQRRSARLKRPRTKLRDALCCESFAFDSLSKGTIARLAWPLAAIWLRQHIMTIDAFPESNSRSAMENTWFAPLVGRAMRELPATSTRAADSG